MGWLCGILFAACIVLFYVTLGERRTNHDLRLMLHATAEDRDTYRTRNAKADNDLKQLRKAVSATILELAEKTGEMVK